MSGLVDRDALLADLLDAEWEVISDSPAHVSFWTRG